MDLAYGGVELRPAQQKLINETTQQGIVGIAAISLWEVAMLAKKGRIRLKKSLLSWIQETLALPGIELQPISPEIAVECSKLPENFHGNPVDRLIVATARLHHFTLLTRDKKILDHAQKGLVSAIRV